MASLINYIKSRAHRAADFPNVIMNSWNRSVYVKPAALFGAACVSNLSFALPEPVSSLMPAIPALGRQLATAFFGFGMASLAHTRQISHASETARIGRKTFWTRAAVAGATIGAMFVSPALAVVASVCTRPILAHAETIQDTDDLGADPSFNEDHGRLPTQEAMPVIDNSSLNSDRIRERDELDEKHEEGTNQSSEDVANETVGGAPEEQSIVAEEYESDSEREIEESDTDEDVSDEENLENLVEANQDLIIGDLNTRALRNVRPLSAEARIKQKIAGCAKPPAQFLQKNSSAIIGAASIGAAVLIPALNTPGLQSLAQKGLLALAVPSVGIWISPKSIKQQPEFAAGIASSLLIIGLSHPTALMVATAGIATVKIGLAAKNRFFPKK